MNLFCYLKAKLIKHQSDYLSMSDEMRGLRNGLKYYIERIIDHWIL